MNMQYAPMNLLGFNEKNLDKVIFVIVQVDEATKQTNAALFFPIRLVIYFYYLHYCYLLSLFMLNIFNMTLNVTWIFAVSK